MRRPLLLIALIIVTVTANAQIKKGAHMLGGSVGYSFQKSDPDQYTHKSSQIYLSPSFGIAVKENLVVGIDLTGNYSDVRTAASKEWGSTYGLGVFARRYYTLGKGFYFFGQGRVGGSLGEMNQTSLPGLAELNTKTLNFNLSLTPGISYAINRRLHVETSLNDLLYAQYSHQKRNYSNSPNDSKSNSFALGSSISGGTTLTLGLRFFFGN